MLISETDLARDHIPVLQLFSLAYFSKYLFSWPLLEKTSITYTALHIPVIIGIGS